MKRTFATIASTTLMLLLVACSQAAPAPTSVTAPVAPVKAAEPTKSVQVQPTTAPAKKTSFPQAGRPITIIVPIAAGGVGDLQARMVAPLLEKELGVPVNVVNKTGAGVQVGTTELVRADPDGHTLGVVFTPATITTYLDPERKAIFGRKDLALVALHNDDPSSLAVKADNPNKTLKDLFDTARANPEKVKVSSSGILTHDHLNALQSEKMAGVKFSIVHFDGAAPSMAALLGGHIDVHSGNVGAVTTQVKSGEIRVLGVADRQQSPYLPGVKTFEEQGYKYNFSSSRGFAAPGGTPREVIDVLSRAMAKVMEIGEHKERARQMGLTLRYMDPQQYSNFWDETETRIVGLMKELGK